MMTNINTEKSSLSLACVILAAGQGTRMKSSLPKVLHKIAGFPMISHVIRVAEDLGAEKIVPIIAPGMEDVAQAVAPYECAVQVKSLGTGDAVRAAQEKLAGFDGLVLVLYGDTPLMTGKMLQALIQKKQDTGAAFVVTGFVPLDAGNYGRLITNEKEELEAIVEAKEATPEQLDVCLCNGGIMLAEAAQLWDILSKITNDNAKGEYYLTDCISHALKAGLTCAYVLCDEEEVLGVNSRQELAMAEGIMQRRLRRRFMEEGVTMRDPESVYLCADTKLGRDVILGPHIVFGPEAVIEDNVEIQAFSHIEKAHVSSGAAIGPYARLRPGAEIGEGAKIGNFVEIKKATVEAGAKVNHLSYIGDARVGAKANIGAGTITCNYDGYNKSHTDIGAGAFIGSNSALVAPVKIGDGAIIGAGSTITKNVEADALAVTRAKQTALAGYAVRFRKSKEK